MYVWQELWDTKAETASMQEGGWELVDVFKDPVFLIFVNLRFFSSFTDQGELAIKWCSDWADFICLSESIQIPGI